MEAFVSVTTEMVATRKPGERLEDQKENVEELKTTLAPKMKRRRVIKIVHIKESIYGKSLLTKSYQKTHELQLWMKENVKRD